jgi:hypothetical protein
MDVSTAAVLIIAIALLCSLVFYALYKKGDVKAGANVGQGSFLIEVKEPKRDGSDRPAADADKVT